MASGAESVEAAGRTVGEPTGPGDDCVRSRHFFGAPSAAAPRQLRWRVLSRMRFLSETPRIARFGLARLVVPC